MKTLKQLLISTVALAGLVISGAALAQSAADMTEGEIRKVDIESKKVTIRHGEIKNLEMPGMTMVFQMKDPSRFSTLKVGDKIKFRAEKAGSNFVVTEIETAKLDGQADQKQ